MSRRVERVAEQIRSELARILREDVSDPRLELLTLTRVEVSPDLSSAVVHWSAVAARGERDPREPEEALQGAAPFVRRCLAERLSLRRTPELHFRHDPSLALGARTLSVLRELEQEREGRKRDGET